MLPQIDEGTDEKTRNSQRYETRYLIFSQNLLDVKFGAVQKCANLVGLERRCIFFKRNIGFDTAQNEPSKILQTSRKFVEIYQNLSAFG